MDEKTAIVITSSMVLMFGLLYSDLLLQDMQTALADLTEQNPEHNEHWSECLVLLAGLSDQLLTVNQ